MRHSRAPCRNTAVLMPHVQKLLKLGFIKWEVANYWGLQIISPAKYDVSLAPFIYILNTEAVLMAQKIGVKRISFALEDSQENIQNLQVLSPLPTSLVIYQDIPLFTSAVCIRKNDCQNCTGGIKWFNLKKDGHTFEALSVPCQTMLFDKMPLCLALEAKHVPTSYYQMDFCFKPYTPESLKATAEKLMRFEDVRPSLTGNFKKT